MSRLKVSVNDAFQSDCQLSNSLLTFLRRYMSANLRVLYDSDPASIEPELRVYIVTRKKRFVGTGKEKDNGWRQR